MKKNTEKNREKLAAEVVNQMDIGTMIEVLTEMHEEFYMHYTDSDLDKEWKDVFGEN